MANEAGPLTVQLIEERLRDKLVAEFKMLRNNAVEPFATFLDFMTYASPVGLFVQSSSTQLYLIYNFKKIFQIRLYDRQYYIIDYWLASSTIDGRFDCSLPSPRAVRGA